MFVYFLSMEFMLLHILIINLTINAVNVVTEYAHLSSVLRHAYEEA